MNIEKIDQYSPVIYFNSYSVYPYNKLSNFYESKFIYLGIPYLTVEHAYQAAKCVLQEDAAKIRNCATAKEAKQLGKSVRIRPEWEAVKISVMKALLRCKFYQSEDLRQLLLSTKGEKLIHQAPWDSFWGTGKDNQGHNMLGNLLMELRQEMIDWE